MNGKMINDVIKPNLNKWTRFLKLMSNSKMSLKINLPNKKRKRVNLISLSTKTWTHHLKIWNLENQGPTHYQKKKRKETFPETIWTKLSFSRLKDKIQKKSFAIKKDRSFILNLPNQVLRLQLETLKDNYQTPRASVKVWKEECHHLEDHIELQHNSRFHNSVLSMMPKVLMKILKDRSSISKNNMLCSKVKLRKFR